MSGADGWRGAAVWEGLKIDEAAPRLRSDAQRRHGSLKAGSLRREEQASRPRRRHARQRLPGRGKPEKTRKVRKTGGELCLESQDLRDKLGARPKKRAQPLCCEASAPWCMLPGSLFCNAQH